MTAFMWAMPVSEAPCIVIERASAEAVMVLPKAVRIHLANERVAVLAATRPMPVTDTFGDESWTVTPRSTAVAPMHFHELSLHRLLGELPGVYYAYPVTRCRGRRETQGRRSQKYQ